MTAAERIYVVGGTGNVGTVVVKELLKKQVPVTLFARSPVKAQSLFGDDANLTIVEGDVNDLAPFEKSISGHTRLFLLVNDFGNMVNLYVGIAEKAYAAGVKQIVQISSISVHSPWRASFIGELNRESEKGIAAIPNRGAFVSLRPFRFMSNITWMEFQGIKEHNVIFDVVDPEVSQEWISPNDIGSVAANILQDPIEKHGDSAYELIGDIVSPKDRAALLSKALGRTIFYKQVTPQEQYNILAGQLGLPHVIAYHLMYQPKITDKATPGLSVLLGHEPETLEHWIEANKAPLL